MSIQSEISRIENAKNAIRQSIIDKGVSVPLTASIDEYSDYIDMISGGGGDAAYLVKDIDITDFSVSQYTLASKEELIQAGVISDGECISGAWNDYCLSLTAISLSNPNDVGIKKFTVLSPAVNLTEKVYGYQTCKASGYSNWSTWPISLPMTSTRSLIYDDLSGDIKFKSNAYDDRMFAGTYKLQIYCSGRKTSS